MTMWWDPAGMRPPVSWAPATGIFETHWDWALTDALSIPGYWRARQLISQAIGAMPLEGWKDTARRDDTETAVLREPNPGEDRCTTVAAWVADLLDHGNAVGYVVNRPGVAPAVIPWPAVSTGVYRDDAGGVRYRFYADGRAVQDFPADRVFHAKGVLPYPGSLRGMGILEAGAAPLARMGAESRYAANAFTVGMPAGLLRVKDPDLQAGSPDDPAGYATASGIKRAWKDNIAAGDIAVLSELVDFTPLGWNPSDAQLVEARQLSLIDVANLFCLDAYWVGGQLASMPYQNVQDAAVQLVRFTLNPPITALEAQFSRLLPRGTEARFNRDMILREQRSQRVATEIAMVQAGIATVDEVRAWEGLNPLADTPDTTPADVVPLFPAESDTTTNESATGTGA